MPRALVVDMYMFSRVWFLHWGSHRYQMKWNPATLILFLASRFMEMDYTARIPSPSPWRIQAWYRAGDAYPFAHPRSPLSCTVQTIGYSAKTLLWT
jgi:hypothetical protein